MLTPSPLILRRRTGRTSSPSRSAPWSATGWIFLVANARISNAATIEETTVEDFDKLFAVNVRAPFFLVQQLLPILGSAAASSCSRRSQRMPRPEGFLPMRLRRARSTGS